MRVYIVILFSLFVGGASADAFDSINSSLIDGLSTCIKVSNDAQRLVCFDQLAQRNVAPLRSKNVSDEVVAPIEQVKSEETKIIDDFSKEVLKKTEEERGPDSITGTISNLKQLIRGQWVVYFESGQKWQQQDSIKIKLKVGDTVRLKKGSMGTVYLFREGGHRNIRVKRLK